jgi:antirestriction protein ArdC
MTTTLTATRHNRQHDPKQASGDSAGISTRKDVYSEVTSKIVALLEKGCRPWHQPWSSDGAGNISRPLRANGVPYRGINVLMLWMASIERGYDSPFFLTFNQVKTLGGSVKKGEKSLTVVYANSFQKKEQDEETGEELTRSINFLRTYSVFNSSQCVNLPAQFAPKPVEPKNHDERLAECEQFFANTKIMTNYGGTRAFYSPTTDSIQMPNFERFESRNAFYNTLGHETIHAVGAPHRLNRTFGKRFGDAEYAFEELVAELGSAFLSVDLGITPEVVEDHASYLSAWLKILKKDSRAIFSAAAHAERAVEFLHRFQPNVDSSPNDDEC